MQTVVTGICAPFSDEWLNQLDRMTHAQAISWVQQHLDASIQHRNRYETEMLKDGVIPGLLNAWCIDNNNIIRFKRLLDQIASEGD